MQIYSAMIPVKETFSKKEFVRLLLEWNQGSPHDRMKGVRWQEEQRLLAVEDLPEKRIIAARFQKTDSYGMIWTSDLVLNLEEKRLSVRLDQEVTEQTSSFFYRFSPPFFYQTGDTEGVRWNGWEAACYREARIFGNRRKRTGRKGTPWKRALSAADRLSDKKMGRLLPSECRAAFGAASGNGSCIERNDAGAWEASEKKM